MVHVQLMKVEPPIGPYQDVPCSPTIGLRFYASRKRINSLIEADGALVGLISLL